jgi:hypothetical protein
MTPRGTAVDPGPQGRHGPAVLKVDVSNMDLVPMSELLQFGHEYTCSRSLFPFVNRNLNKLGFRAKVISVKFRTEDDLVIFEVEKLMTVVA